MLAVPLAERVVNCVSVAFFCVTVPFYVFLLAVITYECARKNRDFSSPFYVLSITTGVIDVVTLLNNYFGSVFPKWCWIKELYLSSEQFWLHTYFFLAWGTGASQALCTTLIALNRLSGVLLGERYSKHLCFPALSPPPPELYLKWVLEAWYDGVTKDNVINSFKACGIGAIGGADDHLIHCLKEGNGIPNGLYDLTKAREAAEAQELAEILAETEIDAADEDDTGHVSDVEVVDDESAASDDEHSGSEDENHNQSDDSEEY